MLSAFAQVFRTPDLRKKLLFTLGILVVFRLGSQIPVPNVNFSAISECAAISETSDRAGIYSMINLFTGGSLLKLAVFALGIMPYITSSIILQLLAVVIPRLEALKKEGSAGQQKITQYTRWMTIVLAVLQATSFTMLAVNEKMFTGCGAVVYSTDIFPVLVMILTMTAGTSIIMWLGELITDRGIGNGMSVLIFTQIVAQFPTSMWAVRQASPGNKGILVFLMVLAVGLLVMAGVVFVEQAQRRIPVQYAKRMVGNKVMGGSTTYIPLKVNQSGVIPVIFASSILYLPVLYALFNPDGRGAAWITNNLYQSQDTSFWYNAIFLVLIVFFCYFYVSITFNPVEISDNMAKYGGFIPGYRAGKPTSDYLAFVLSRLTAPGAIYLCIISIIPTIAIVYFGAGQKFPFGGTSLLIIVGVGLDTVKQIESQLHQRKYEGFLK
jgi:preprotein translocase subunit SecY